MSRPEAGSSERSRAGADAPARHLARPEGGEHYKVSVLDGRVAVVTGAMGLLGRQHVLALAEAGARVVATDIQMGELEGADFTYSTDITSRADLERLRDAVLGRYDRLDALVNNAALNDKVEDPTRAPKDFESYPLERWKRELDVNVTGTFLACQVLGSVLARRGGGSIVNIASTYGIVAPDPSLYRRPDGTQAFIKSPAYPTSKAAILGLTRHLAATWGSAGVRVNALSPGGVENGQEAFFVEAYARKTPLGRMARPDDYRGALVFLCSDASAYMTGANLVVDGGWTCW